MKFFSILCFIFIFQAITCSLKITLVSAADPDNKKNCTNLVIAAGLANYERFANISKKWHDSYTRCQSQSKDSNVRILANVQSEDPEEQDENEELKSMWEFAPYSPFDSEKSLSAAISDLSKKEHSKSLVIFINDHGSPTQNTQRNAYIERGDDGKLSEVGWDFSKEKWAPRNRTNFKIRPGLSRISLPAGKEYISHQKISDSLRSVTRNYNAVKIIGIHCYSGGTHEIAHKNQNTCSLSSSDYLSPSFSNIYINLYGEGIIDERNATASNKKFDLNKDGKTSMLEAHFAGLANDNINFGRNTTSSMAYLDKVLSQGAYAHNEENLVENFLPTENELALSMTCKYNRTHNFFKRLTSFINRNFNPFIDRNYIKVSDKTNILTDHTPIHLDPEEFNSLPKALRPIAEGLRTNPEVLSAYHQLRRESPKIQEKILQYSQQKDTLELKLNKAVSSNQKSNIISELNKKLTEINENIREQNDQLQEVQARWRGFFRYFKFLKDIRIFQENATGAQKRKFNELIKCETGEL